MSDLQDKIVVEEVVGSKDITKGSRCGGDKKQQKQRLIKSRPSLLRSPPSIQLTTYTAHAHNLSNEDEELSPPSSSSSSSSKETTIRRKPASSSPKHANNNTPAMLSRTQHKMLLQRQSFLADDKNYLDHPDNMRRLTKELERVNREYRCVKQFQDPLVLSMKRVMTAAFIQQQQQRHPLSPVKSHNSNIAYAPAVSYVASSLLSCNSSYLVPPQPQIVAATRLQRRASYTVHDYLLNFKDQQERRHSFSFYHNTGSSSSDKSLSSSIGFISRIFFGPSTTIMHHSPFSSSQLKRHNQTHVT